MPEVLQVQANEYDAAKRTVGFFLLGTDGLTPAAGEANGQPQVSTDGGVTWSATGIGTLQVGARAGYYAAVLTQTIVATPGTIIRTSYKSGNTLECPGDTVQVVTPTRNIAINDRNITIRQS